MASSKEPEQPAATAEPAQVERREYRAYCGCCDLLWIVTTVEGWLKLLEWIATFLAFVIILAFFQVPIERYSQKPEYHFMIFVAITSWVFINVHIVLKMTHLFEKLPGFLRHYAVGTACSLLATLSFLVASSVVLAYAKGWSELKASAACGYVAMFLFLIEAIFIFIRGRRRAAAAARTTKTKEKTDKADDKEQAVGLLHDEKKEKEKGKKKEGKKKEEKKEKEEEDEKKDEGKAEEEKKDEDKKGEEKTEEEESAHPFPK